MTTRSNSPHFPSKTRKVANTVLDAAVKGLEVSKDVITAAALIPGLSIALDLLVATLKKVQATESNCNASQSLARTADELVNSLRRLAEQIQEEFDEYPAESEERRKVREGLTSCDKLIKRVERLWSELDAICSEADKLSRRGFFSRLVFSGRDTEALSNMEKRIAEAHKRFQTEGDVTVEIIVTKTSNDIKMVIAEQQKILAAQRLSEEEHVLNSIPRAEDAHFLAAANTTKARFQQGTRQLVFDCLEEWEDAQFENAEQGNRPIPVCVLVGHAGTGKSTIASEFSRRLQERGRLGASFFFTRGVQDLNSPRKVFSTISSQLARSQQLLRVPVLEAAREHLKVTATQQLRREFEDFVRAPLSKLAADHAPIFVVIDALDECTKDGADLVPELLRLLLSEAALRPGSPLRVFITSRPEPHYIHDVFSASDVKSHIFVIDIQTFRHSVDRDIERLICAKLAEHEKSKEWSEARPDVVRRLVELSDGLFIYARTAVDFILGGLYGIQSMQELYDTLDAEGPHRGLTALDRLYLTVLQGISSPADYSPRVQERLQRMLGYLVTLQEPEGISPATLEKLTDMPTSESVPILNKLRSVVRFDRDNVHSPFRIVHTSFREFMEDHERAGEAFYVNTEDFHGRLADGCMRVIQSFPDELWPGVAGAPALLLRLLTSKTLPDLSEFHHALYAGTYYDHHLSHGTSVPPPIFRQDLWESPPDDLDDTSPSTAIVMSYLRKPQYPNTRQDMACIVGARLQRELVAGSTFGDTSSSVNENLQNEASGLLRWAVLKNRDKPKSWYTKCLTISLILDIQTLMNYATDTPEKLDENHVQKLTTSLKEVFAMDYVMYPNEVRDMLIEAHRIFHRAIIAAGLATGHPHEE